MATQLDEGVGRLAEQDEVDLEVTFNRRTGARRARAIHLVDRAGARRELGQARVPYGCLASPAVQQGSRLNFWRERDLRLYSSIDAVTA